MELLSKSAARNSPFLTLGKILSPHGLKGALKVHSFSDFPEHLLTLERVFVLSEPEAESARQELVVEHVQAFKGKVFLFFLAEVETREAAEALSKSYLAIPKSEAPELPEDTFYIQDLIGFAVLDSEGHVLGEVHQMIQNQQDLIVLKTPEGREHWIPFVRELVPEVRFEQRQLVVKLVEGLLDL